VRPSSRARGLRRLTHFPVGGDRVIATGGGAVDTIQADVSGPVTHPRLSPRITR
jgi:hypothetical protein